MTTTTERGTLDAPATTGSSLGRPKKTLFSMLASPRGLWRFLRDREAPWASRIVTVLTLIYVVSPLDAIPDWLVPVLGWMDDVGLTAAALAFVAAQAARYENEHDVENPERKARP